MTQVEEARLDAVERATHGLAERIVALEARVGLEHRLARQAQMTAPPPWPAPVAVTPDLQPPESPSSAAATGRVTRPGLEDLLGGRVLAWTGGLAIVLGVAFLLAIAVSSGWIGPGARTLLAGTISVAFIVAGIWLHERRRRTDAALATLAAGIAAMFVTVAVGGPVYGVLSAGVATLLALGSGAIATALAIRWQARGIGALGIIGALLAPVLAGAPPTLETLALLWLAGLSGAAILVWQRWNWLALAVFAVALPQWVTWLLHGPPAASVLLVLTGFGALNVGAAAGFELRVPAARLRPSSALLLTFNALVLAVGGWFALRFSGDDTLAHIWIAALAALHLAVGLALTSTRCNRDVRLLAMALGVVLADVTLGLVLHGPVLAAAWALTSTGLALLAHRTLAGRDDRAGRAHDELALGIGLGGHLLLSAVQAIVQAPPTALGDDQIALGGPAAVAAVACAAFVAGRFAEDVRREWRAALDALAIVGVAYLTALTLDGAVLAAAFAFEALALGTIAARTRDAVAAWGAGAFLAAGLLHSLIFEAAPAALVLGLEDPAGAAVALGAAACAALRGAQLLREAVSESPAVLAHRAAGALASVGALALLYLASTALITPFAPGDATPLSSAVELGSLQLGQALLSALWAVVGVSALVTGLHRDLRALRLGALGLLLVTVAKVFLYDLAALTSLYRVASFIGLGLVLLVAAAIWQRMRPRPLPDLRAVPPGLR